MIKKTNKNGKVSFLSNKKGQGHVEFIAATILFIGIIIFIILFLNPFVKSEEKVSIADDIKKIIIENISEEVGILSAIVNNPNADCFDLSGINLIDNYGTDHYIDSNVNTGNLRKYNIYFSEIFPVGNPSCSANLDRNFQLGIYSKKRMIIYSKVLNLVNLYNQSKTSYSSLKTLLDMKGDFSFNFRYLNRTNIDELSVDKKSPVGINRESKDYHVQVLDNTGKVEELILNIRTW